ncbi:EFR1 family ferrodoxin [Desulfocurvibacter africanus]|uniref:EFR1 family ferrodoxin n=1 Tax=Desulfocurvibacter africanus TaxID=873 RepID=UPI0003FF76CA|nr:EFR1 family ferrodoxin [Desulfocurvibacter africanus]
MNMESVKLVYFSPTGTTQAVARSIAQGMNPGSLEAIDITRPEARRQPLLTSENELLVVAVPVYMGRVPALVTEWLNALQAHDTPTVCVVVYGNRAYEDALLELKTILTQCGCIPIACAAYIGEHSFSSSETPVAQGRPDKADLSHAQAFGQRIREKLQAIASISQIPDVHVPGIYPYTRDSKLWTVDFIAVNDQCTHCGLCAEVCPTGAVDPHDSSLIQQEICITCCACIKSCPQSARSMKPSPVKDASIRLTTLFKEPKQSECFL